MKQSNDKKRRLIMSEDMLVLQKMISGKSVYSGAVKVYRRIPKHKKQVVGLR